MRDLSRVKNPNKCVTHVQKQGYLGTLHTSFTFARSPKLPSKTRPETIYHINQGSKVNDQQNRCTKYFWFDKIKCPFGLKSVDKIRLKNNLTNSGGK